MTHDSSNGIREILQLYTLHRQDYPSDKYSSLTLCNKGNIHILENQYFLAINGLMFDVLNSITNRGITMLLVYRKNNSNIMQYINHLSNILQIHTIDIILGDLNINYFKELPTLPLKELVNYYGYIQIVDTATFVSAGTLLDHVYVKQSLCDKIRYEVIGVYYSGHDCVKIIIQP